jgi:hypothetical protein
VIYPVVSVIDRDVQGKKVFQWEEGEKGFVEIRV